MIERRILVTGAAGRIGSVLAPALAGRYARVRLADLEEVRPPAPDVRCHVVDLTDLEAVFEVASGVDTIVHLATAPEALNRDWEHLLASNIVATRNVYEAARRTGVRRVVFASSNHVHGFYRTDETVSEVSPLRPDSLYAVTKAFGEALARFHHDKHGLSSVLVRIGSFQERPRDRRMLATWLSPRDAVHLFQRAIEAEDVGCAIVFGVSANRRAWVENTGAAVIGYRPQDDAEDFAADFAGPPPEFQGGDYCRRED